MRTGLRKGRFMKGRQADRKLWVRVIALILVVLLIGGVIFSAVVAMAEEAPERDCYSLDMEVLLKEQAVHVTQNLDYVNRTGAPLDRVMFSVYMNVLRRQNAIPVESGDYLDAFPAGYAPGGVDFIRVQVNGEAADWGVQGDAETFLRVACPLEPGQQARFSFEYYVLLPVYSGAMGVGDLTWRLTNFYPVAAVYDEEKQDFALGAYHAVGEALYADAADYQVSLSLPEGWALAAPGEIRETREDGTVRYEVRAQSIRELALVFSRKMVERSGYTGRGTKVRVLANTASTAKALLETALPAVDFFSDWLGQYPYDGLTLIETEYLYEGLSDPGVVQISHELCGVFQREVLARNTVRRLAEQWFSCVVGVDRSREPWLSDALPAYAALLYEEENGGYDAYLKQLNEQVLSSLNVTVPGGVSVESEADRFTSRMEYEMVVIDRGMAVLHEVRRAMGRETLMEGLREYVSFGWMRTACFDDLADAFEKASGGEWREYLIRQMKDIDEYVGMGLEWYE